MSTAFHLTIVTPQGKSLEKDVVFVKAPGAGGEFGVLAKHAPMVSSLKSGILSVRDVGGELHYAIGSGVLEINDQSKVLVLCDVAESSADLKEAEIKLAQIVADKSKQLR